jgi:mRNA interferase MazF
MTSAFGDIYLVAFEPSIGHEFKKKRPAMIIQQEPVSNFSCITIVPITSKIEKHGPYDVFIQKDHVNNLTHDSLVAVRHIMTFDKSRFLHYIGKAGSPVIRQVRGYLRRHFGM